MKYLAIALSFITATWACSAPAPAPAQHPTPQRNTWCNPTGGSAEGAAACPSGSYCPQVLHPCAADELWPSGQQGTCMHFDGGQCECRALCQPGSQPTTAQ